MAFGSDSHTAFTLGHFDYCLRIAREVDFPEDRVLNVTPRRLLDFLEMRSGKHIAELADF
ncbi:histidinol-phosphatase [Pantoea vagans]|nr:histidinol-phosphatase [Pantoea vagans]